MAIVRILVDGYSLLHVWRDLAPGEPRHTAHARDALIAELTQYADSTHTPITVFFDGSGAPAGTPKPEASEGLEIIYSTKGKTADDLIERTAHRLKPYGEALAITNDLAERDTVISLGGMAQSCEEFIKDIERVMNDRNHFVKIHNRREANRYKRR
jgi:predicted RNA-binding protein with PIN domain